MNKKSIIKYVSAFLAIIVLSIIIYLTYIYYMDKGLKNNNSSSSSNEVIDNGSSNTDKETKEEKLEFDKYNNVKQIVSVNNKVTTINNQTTDAGDVLLVNDNTVFAYTKSDIIEYSTLKDILVFKVTNDYEGTKLYFVNNSGDVLKEVLPDLRSKYNVLINKPLLSDQYKEELIFDNNKFTVTYVINHDEDYNIILNNEELLEPSSNLFLNGYKTDEVVEYTIEFEYLGNDRFTETKTIEEFTLINYVEEYKK